MAMSKLKPEDADLIESGIKVLSPLWTAAILLHLSRGKRRAMHLREALPGLSAKILTERLRALQQRGLLKRKSFREFPPRVEYSLTANGEDAVRLLGSVGEVTAKLIGREIETSWNRRQRNLKVKKRK